MRHINPAVRVFDGVLPGPSLTCRKQEMDGSSARWGAGSTVYMTATIPS